MDPAGVFNVAAGAGMVALAVFLLAVDFASRLHRALAAFLVLRGVMNVVQAIIAPGALVGLNEPSLALRVYPYFDVAVLGATLWFGWVFHLRQRAAPVRAAWDRAVLVAVVAMVLVAWLAYARDHALWLGDGTSRGWASRPLAAVQWLRMVALAGLAFVFARSASAAASRARRSAALLASAAFVLVPVASTIVVAVVSVALARDGVTLLMSGFPLVAFVTLVLGLSLAATWTVARGPPDRARRAFVFGMAAVAAVSVVVGLVAFVNIPAAARLFRVVDGLASLAAPVLLAVAVLRHRLFDMDPKVKWTISRGTVATAFVAVFFVASEGASAFFQGWTGSAYVGIAAAGLLVFALAPLQRAADRVADAALPHARPLATLSRDDRVALYREQVRAAWADGAMSRDERRLLEVAREKLGLTSDEVLLVEREIAA